MAVVLFGSIGTIADTSELQREAFNDAFREHGLDWNWSRQDYRKLLRDSGGVARIAAYAQARGDTVDAEAVHRTKSELLQATLRAARPAPRPGVVDTIEEARSNGYKLALVTTTSAENVAALADAVRPEVDLEAFDLVLDTTTVERPKPDFGVYRLALERLGEAPDGCVAIEDNVAGVESAVSAGLTCVAFPGESNADHEFDGAAGRVAELTFAELQTLVPAA